MSKWTKVKAAFKWEKTNALPLIESKSSDSVLSPNNSELARYLSADGLSCFFGIVISLFCLRYLRVPTNPHGCSSGDSLISASSSYRLGTPPEISSAASSADENDDEKSRLAGKRFPSKRDIFLAVCLQLNHQNLILLFTFKFPNFLH